MKINLLFYLINIQVICYCSTLHSGNLLSSFLGGSDDESDTEPPPSRIVPSHLAASDLDWHGYPSRNSFLSFISIYVVILLFSRWTCLPLKAHFAYRSCAAVVWFLIYCLLFDGFGFCPLATHRCLAITHEIYYILFLEFM